MIKGGKLALGVSAALVCGTVGGIFGPSGAKFGQQAGGQVWDTLRKDKSENKIRCPKCGWDFEP